MFVLVCFARFKDTWNYCMLLNDKESWITLGKAALQNLDIEFGKMSNKNAEIYLANFVNGLI